MHLPSRRTILARTLALLASSQAPAVRAQAYPNKAIRLWVPFAPGGGPDGLARQFLPQLGAALGQAVFVENKVGAGGLIAAEHVAQLPADGYNLLLGASTHVTQKLLQPKAAFDPLKSFTHVTRLSMAPAILVVAAGSPYQSLADLLKAARAQPGRLNYGSGGIGSAAHLAGAALAQVAGVEVAHIPYRGSVDLATALAGGDLHFAIPTASTVVPLLQSGKLRALAVTSALREPQLPQLPTLRELTGSDDLVLVSWSVLWLPANAPAAVTKRLYDAYHQVYTEPEVVRAHAAVGVTVTLSATQAEAGQFVAAEMAKYSRIVTAAKIGVN
jgi:tripartite-type tricarboxylate transporter receptor subunit TctC